MSKFADVSVSAWFIDIFRATTTVYESSFNVLFNSYFNLLCIDLYVKSFVKSQMCTSCDNNLYKERHPFSRKFPDHNQ